jgi:hypothetical protein
VAQIFEERWQSQGIYSARDDGRRLRHAMPYALGWRRRKPRLVPAQMARQRSQASPSSREDLVRILLEREESTIDLLMRLRVLDDTMGKRDVVKFASLPLHARLLALTARDSALLGSNLVAEDGRRLSE